MSGLNAIEMSSLPRARRSHDCCTFFRRPDRDEPTRTGSPQGSAERAGRPALPSPSRPPAAPHPPASSPAGAALPSGRRRRPRSRPAGPAFQSAVRPPVPPARPPHVPETLPRLRADPGQREAGGLGPDRLPRHPTPLAARGGPVAPPPPPRPAPLPPPTPRLFRRVGPDRHLDPRVDRAPRRGDGLAHHDRRRHRPPAGTLLPGGHRGGPPRPAGALAGLVWPAAGPVLGSAQHLPAPRQGQSPGGR